MRDCGCTSWRCNCQPYRGATINSLGRPDPEAQIAQLADQYRSLLADYNSIITENPIVSLTFNAPYLTVVHLNGQIDSLGPFNTVTPTLGSLTLSGNLQIGVTTSGTIIGATVGSTIASNIPGITVNSGARTYTGTPTGTAGTISNGLVESLTGSPNSPKSNVVTVLAANMLAALTMSDTNYVIGVPESGTINGATAGSTISATGLPTGLTINGPARTWAYDGTGSAATTNITLTETLAGYSNSPNPNVIAVTIASDIPTFISPPVLTRTSSISAPLDWTTSFPPDAQHAGYRLHRQMSATTDFSGTLQYDGQYVIQLEDYEDGKFPDSEFYPPFDPNAAPGPHFVRERYESGDDLVSAWSNTLDMSRLAGMVVEGDSITAAAGSYANRFNGHFTSTAAPFSNQSVGGNGLTDVVSRKSTTLGKYPAVFTLLIGANDLIAYSDGPTYLAAIRSTLTDEIRATGCKIVLCSILPQSTAYSPGHNAKAIQFNTAAAAAVGTGFDLFVDWRTSVMWLPDGNAAATNTAKYYDGALHPSDGSAVQTQNGQAQLEPRFRDAVLTALGLPPSATVALDVKYNGVTLSNSGKTMTGAGPGLDQPQPARSNRDKIVGGNFGATGYFEMVAGNPSGTGAAICLIPADMNLDDADASKRLPGGSYSPIGNTGCSWFEGGAILKGGSFDFSGWPTFSAGDVLGFYYDNAQQKLWASKNGVWVTATGDPSAGGAGYSVPTEGSFYAGGLVYKGVSQTFRFKASEQQYRGSLQAWEL